MLGVAYFGESCTGEVRRIPIPRTRVNKGKKKGRGPDAPATYAGTTSYSRRPENNEQEEGPVTPGHLDAELTTEEREALRDLEARAWGSQDVSEEELQSRLDALTPRQWKRVGAASLARMEASRKRQLALEEGIERLEQYKRDLLGE